MTSDKKKKKKRQPHHFATEKIEQPAPEGASGKFVIKK